MDYRESRPSDRLNGLVKAIWQLEIRGRPRQWIEHHATPDGCVELIRRTNGRSRWNGEQPERFVVGLSDTPIAFEISGDSGFCALRLWPWTWYALSGQTPSELAGRWSGALTDRISSLLDVIDDQPELERRLLTFLGKDADGLAEIGRSILGSASVAEMSRLSGMAPRTLQRWFALHVGVSPRLYLRLLRFQQAFEALPGADRLVDHAASHGFADQAHMAREFRRMAGGAASRVKVRTTGPFID